MARVMDAPPLLEGRLGIDVRRGPEEVVLVVSGELDLATVPLLAAAMAGVLREGARPHVVLDLAGLDFMDAAGLGCITRTERRLSTRGGALVVRGPSPPARRLLELCDLDGLVC